MYILRIVDLWIKGCVKSRAFCCAAARVSPLRLVRLSDSFIQKYLHLSTYFPTPKANLFIQFSYSNYRMAGRARLSGAWLFLEEDVFMNLIRRTNLSGSSIDMSTPA